MAWTLRVDPYLLDGPLYETAGVLDDAGRLFVGHQRGLAAVDTLEHEILWQFQEAPNALSAASLYGGSVLFGSENDVFYCVDAASGEVIWTRPALPHPDRSSVVSDAGIVYYPSQLNALYARRVADGGEVWTRTFNDIFRSPPSLDGAGALFLPTMKSGVWFALAESDGRTLWTSPLLADPFGLSCVVGDTVYVASRHHLHALDRATGEERWSFGTTYINGGPAAVRDDGVVYITASNFATGALYAVDPTGTERWRYGFTNQGDGRPGIVDADGTFYFCTNDAADTGYVHAVKADGSALWIRTMPDLVTCSPTLAPDGTLFVMCSDKHLYAFKDSPSCPEDLDGDGAVGFGDLLAILLAWGPCAACPEDLDENGVVGMADLLAVLVAWGPCAA